MTARGSRRAAGGPSRPPASRAVRLVVPELTDAQRLDCAINLAAVATGRGDLRELLSAAGLDRGHLKALRDEQKARCAAGEGAQL